MCVHGLSVLVWHFLAAAADTLCRLRGTCWPPRAVMPQRHQQQAQEQPRVTLQPPTIQPILAYARFPALGPLVMRMTDAAINGRYSCMIRSGATIVHEYVCMYAYAVMLLLPLIVR